MNIETQTVSTSFQASKPEGYIRKEQVLPGEIKGLTIEYISVKGPFRIDESSLPGFYNVLLSLKGNACLSLSEGEIELNAKSISRIPLNQQYSIEIKNGDEFYCLGFKKQLDEQDSHLISQQPEKHSSLYFKALADCPGYTEDIKSCKTINRMILPEGLVPRFCMGSVETTGPDLIMEHEHPMLDQLFFGLDNCKCTCVADGDQTILSENMMLHIPLGSKHFVSVAEGDTLAYIWLDFFFTLDGQKYMGEQHNLIDD